MKNQIIAFRSDLLDSSVNVAGIVTKINELKKNGIGVIVVIGLPERIEPISCRPEGIISDILPVNAAQTRASAVLVSEVLSTAGLKAAVLDWESSGLGIICDVETGRIKNLNPSKVTEMVSQGVIPVVSGSFGLDDKGHLRSLGSGGAEALAVGIASYLENSVCTVLLKRYLPVDSINPRCRYGGYDSLSLSYQECMEMEVAGGHILPARVVELAEKNDIPLILVPFCSEQGGLLVMKKELDENLAVSAIVSDTKTAKVAILGVPDVPGIAARIFTALADVKITTEMIIQSIMRGQINDIAFLVKKEDIEATIDRCRAISKAIGAQGVTFDMEIARVSLIGSGIANHPDIPSRMFSILAEKGINIEMIVASSISITCVVDSPREQEAVNSLKAYFMGGE